MNDLKTVNQSKVATFHPTNGREAGLPKAGRQRNEVERQILELRPVGSRFLRPDQCKQASSGSIGGPIELTDQLEAQVKAQVEAQVISNNGTKLGLSKDQVLKPLLEAELLEMTQPNSPKSPTQKYRLTEKGQQLLNQMDTHS